MSFAEWQPFYSDPNALNKNLVYLNIRILCVLLFWHGYIYSGHIVSWLTFAIGHVTLVAITGTSGSLSLSQVIAIDEILQHSWEYWNQPYGCRCHGVDDTRPSIVVGLKKKKIVVGLTCRISKSCVNWNGYSGQTRFCNKMVLISYRLAICSCILSWSQGPGGQYVR